MAPTDNDDYSPGYAIKDLSTSNGMIAKLSLFASMWKEVLVKMVINYKRKNCVAYEAEEKKMEPLLFEKLLGLTKSNDQRYKIMLLKNT